MFSKPELDSLQPLQNDEFLPPISRWMTLGGMFLVGTFGAAVLLASLIEYNVKVRAMGNVRPAGERQITQAETQGILKSVEVKENQVVEAGGVIAYIDNPNLPRLETAKNSRAAKIQEDQTKLAQTKAQLEVLDKKILTQAGLTSSGQPGENIDFVLERALAKIAKNQSKQAQQLANQRQSLKGKLNETNGSLSRRQAELQRIEAEINKSVVRAPTAGTILKLDVQNPGQRVSSGDAIAQIVPTNSPLVIKTQVYPKDIAKVEIGQTVQMQVSAYPYPDYGTLQGEVIEKTPDAFPCQGNCLGRATTYYEVVVMPERSYLVKGGSLTDDSGAQKSSITPGMEITADIISGKERVITFILRKAKLLTDV
ncbi:MAG: HlyD family efflux transporter periplasmic adaptor subunit [Symploca sp. SIO2C1]|nr:HlyD family efflux transporter periplasmic adaptor subunit [Symploca sp. SIO2C1]